MTSKYDRLGDHLAALGVETITLTFAEVESIIGPLPKAARHLPSWWEARPGTQFHHALYWQNMGYIAARPDFAAGTVTFHRVGIPRPQRHIAQATPRTGPLGYRSSGPLVGFLGLSNRIAYCNLS